MNKRLAFRAIAGPLIAVALLAGAQSAAFASGPGPLPDCAYGNVATPYSDYSDWSRTLLDTTLRIGRSYVPPKLVSITKARIVGDGKVRRFVLQDLYDLKYAAWKAGNPIAVVSAYRSYDKQKAVFQYWVDRAGYDDALKTSARAGHSEHQLGTTLDFKSKNGPDPWTVSDWGATQAGQWMAANAWRYGFVMSYPKGERPKTCYSYEPWHFRYFGKDVAALIHQSELTSRQWLWRHGFGVE